MNLILNLSPLPHWQDLVQWRGDTIMISDSPGPLNLFVGLLFFYYCVQLVNGTLIEEEEVYILGKDPMPNHRNASLRRVTL